MPFPDEIEVGTIVDANVPGANHNPRPVVVLRVTTVEQRVSSIFAVGITSTPVEDATPKIALPFGFHGSRRRITGLKKSCVVSRVWIFELQQEDVISFRGKVPSELMLQIVKAIKSIRPDTL